VKKPFQFNPWLALLLSMFLPPLCGFAQTNSAVLRGTISDPTGARVPAATVVLEEINQGGGREATADSEGTSVFTNLNPMEARPGWFQKRN